MIGPICGSILVTHAFCLHGPFANRQLPACSTSSIKSLSTTRCAQPMRLAPRPFGGSEQPLGTGLVPRRRARPEESPPTFAAVRTGSDTISKVQVYVEKAPNNSRRVFAGIDIKAPVDVVWDALTNYDGLDKFIPGLTENKCLERRSNGARLLQVGAQDLAMGVKFCARVILDIYEFFQGVPAELCSTNSGGADEKKFPQPRTTRPASRSQDIAFTMVEGDFQDFRGIWRLQSTDSDPKTTRLSYSLFVRPQIWLPVQLIQARIEKEVANNLLAVQQYTEKQFRNGGMRQ